MSKWYEIKAVGAKSADILIYDEIGEYGVSAKDFANDLKDLGDVQALNVSMNSLGGSVKDGNAIYNLLQQHKAKVNISIDSIAASMASVIAMSGDTVSMAENALLMIHNPFGMAVGDSAEMKRTADVMDKMKDNMIKAYQAKTGIDAEELSAMMDAETWMTADEAKELGFVDEITGAVDIAASFDFSKYDFKNAPAALQEFGNSSAILQKEFSGNGDTPDINQSAAADQSKEETQMPPVDQKAVEADVKAAAEKAAAEAIEKENTRKQEVSAVFAGHDEYADLMTECIMDSAVDANEARTRLLDAIGKASKPAVAADVRMGEDSRDKFRAGALEAIAIRTGSAEDKGDNDFRGHTLLDLAKASLKHANVSTRGMDKMRIVAAAFTHTSSDFPYLLENSLGKELRNAYGNFAETWSMWCDVGSVPDFKANSRIQLGSFNSLQTIEEGGEYTFGSFGEERETIQAATKGKAISLNRQMIINDDLGGFMRIARMMGRAAARTVGADAYGLLQANAPVMSDGFAPFSSQHNNLPTGAAPSATTLGAARALMRKQKDADGNDYLNIQPAYILAGVEQEDSLNVLLASETDPGQSNSRKPNPARNMAQLITDPRLNASEWYLVADPNEAPLIEIAFLDGNQTPYLESQNGFTVDGVMWKVRLDYGLAFIDYRGGVKGNS